ncbi:Uncharacterized protein Fot_42126 [Forsythia ovata]|uniref:Uncharacterized protein n=1 Tax=Forsythia ovata TaxID=205694 RepID=A0ABD1RL94_9LAMI
MIEGLKDGEAGLHQEDQKESRHRILQTLRTMAIKVLQVRARLGIPQPLPRRFDRITLIGSLLPSRRSPSPDRTDMGGLEEVFSTNGSTGAFLLPTTSCRVGWEDLRVEGSFIITSFSGRVRILALGALLGLVAASARIVYL